MSLANTSQHRRIGIALVCITTLMFSVLDASAKYLVQTESVFEVVFFRFLIHAVMFTVSMAPRLKSTKISSPRLQILRGVLLGSMTLLNFTALQYLQLAETGAIQFSVPILIALLSAWWLKEHLDTGRWLAIATGFIGVLFIIRPGAHSFHPAIFLSIINAFLYASFNLMTRHLASSEDPLITQILSAWIAVVMVAPIVNSHWHFPQNYVTWGFLLLAGVAGGLGHWTLAIAHRYASAAVLGPYLYQQILYMTFWGWLLFDQTPDAAVVIGGAIVVASGFYLLWREFSGRELLKT